MGMIEGAASGLSMGYGQKAASLGGQMVKPQTGAEEIISRLHRTASELMNTRDLANNIAVKIVGHEITEPQSTSNPNRAVEAVASPDFLSRLRDVVDELERLPGSINMKLNRIDQSF